MEKAIIVYLEVADGQPVKVSLEALNAARQYAAKSGKGVSAVLIGAADAAAAVVTYGVDEVLTVAADGYQPEAYAATLADICARYNTETLFVGSTRDGKELSARVAALLGAGCVTDAMALAENGWVRSVYGGSLMETVAVNGKAVISVRSGTFGKPDQDAARTAPVTEETVEAVELRAVIKEAVV